MRQAPIGRFSVIIPTLQRSPDLHPLVEQCASHPRVQEVLVINNAPQPLSWDSEKIRVLQQEHNIYVNPAWNLGAREARGEYLAIVNDDVRFEDEALDFVGQALDRGYFGIIGPDKSNFYGFLPGGMSLRIATMDNISFGFGTFMAMKREDYIPIPEDMRIWGGDDWLFLQQRKPNAILLGTPFETEMSTTSSSHEFARLRAEELVISAPILGALRHTRWWHRPVEALAMARKVRHRVSKLRRG